LKNPANLEICLHCNLIGILELLDSDYVVWHFQDPTTEFLKDSTIKGYRDMYQKVMENNWSYDLSRFGIDEMFDMYFAGNSSFYLTQYRYSFFLKQRVEKGLPRNMMIFKVVY